MISSDTLTLLRTQSLTGLVQKELERQIVAGSLKPGDPLREGTIAAALGISRGPVREAFRMLEERGLVAFAKNCGVQVRRLDGAQAAQIYQVRIPLEGLIGELAAHHWTDATGQPVFTPLMERLQHAVQTQDVANYAGLNLAFHDALAALTGNQVLHDTYRRLVIQLKLFRSHTFKHNPQTIRTSLEEHTRILSAIAANNAPLASHMLAEHARDSLMRLNAALDVGL